MDSSIFCFATDLADEGIETVLDNVEQRGGLGGITVAAAYHEGRDVFPHNPVRKVRFLEGGAVFFPPGPALRATRAAAARAARRRVLPEIVAAAERRGLAVRAWTVFLHNGALAAAHPECAPENAFGDRYLTELCPANPDARAYARALAADIARARCRGHLLRGAPLPGPRARLRARALLRPAQRASPVPPRALLLRALPRGGAGGRRRRRRGPPRGARGDRARVRGRRIPAASPSATSTRGCASRS